MTRVNSVGRVGERSFQVIGRERERTKARLGGRRDACSETRASEQASQRRHVSLGKAAESELIRCLPKGRIGSFVVNTVFRPVSFMNAPVFVVFITARSRITHYAHERARRAHTSAGLSRTGEPTRLTFAARLTRDARQRREYQQPYEREGSPRVAPRVDRSENSSGARLYFENRYHGDRAGFALLPFHFPLEKSKIKRQIYFFKMSSNVRS